MTKYLKNCADRAFRRHLDQMDRKTEGFRGDSGQIVGVDRIGTSKKDN